MNPNENTRVACGKPIPEGRQVCLECEEEKYDKKN